MKLAVLALSLSFAVPALADSLVIPVSGSLADGGSAAGTLTVDTNAAPDASNPATWDVLTGIDFTVADNGTNYTFDSISYQTLFSGEYYGVSTDSTGDVLLIGFPVSQLANLGTDNSEFCTAAVPCVYGSSFIQSGQSPVQFSGIDSVGSAPEPSSLILLGTGILGVAGAARRRFVRA